MESQRKVDFSFYFFTCMCNPVRPYISYLPLTAISMYVCALWYIPSFPVRSGWSPEFFHPVQQICLCFINRFFLFFKGIGSSWGYMLLILCFFLSNSTKLPGLGLLPERNFSSLCGRCTTYCSESTVSTSHSSEDCPGTCNKYVFFKPVVPLLRCLVCFVLCLPVQPF